MYFHTKPCCTQKNSYKQPKGRASRRPPHLVEQALNGGPQHLHKRLNQRHQAAATHIHALRHSRLAAQQDGSKVSGGRGYQQHFQKHCVMISQQQQAGSSGGQQCPLLG